MKLSITTGVLERRFGFDGAVKLIAGDLVPTALEYMQKFGRYMMGKIK